MHRAVMEDKTLARILVCDDERDIVSALRIYLETEGYEVVPAYSGKETLELLDGGAGIDLVLMDVMMPGMNGIETVHAIRKTSNVPIIMLTAKSEDTDKVLGLNVGADDYVTKPFNPLELLARVRSQLRRYTQLGSQEKPAEGIYTLGGLQLDDLAKEVTVDGEKVAMTPTEYAILKLFLLHPGEVLSPNRIYREVWQDEPIGLESTVAVHIRHLREKIEINPSDPRYLKVVWGQGYKLVPQEDNRRR